LQRPATLAAALQRPVAPAAAVAASSYIELVGTHGNYEIKSDTIIPAANLNTNT